MAHCGREFLQGTGAGESLQLDDAAATGQHLTQPPQQGTAARIQRMGGLLAHHAEHVGMLRARRQCWPWWDPGGRAQKGDLVQLHDTSLHRQTSPMPPRGTSPVDNSDTVAWSHPMEVAMTLVCVPADLELLRRLRADGITDVAAHAATPALYEAMGYTPDMDEDAEFAALTFASAAAAIMHGEPRLVIVAEAEAIPVPEDEFGAVRVPMLAWPQVTALFVGEHSGRQAEAAAHDEGAGSSLDQAWDAPAIQDLVRNHDMLWYAPEEADAVERML